MAYGNDSGSGNQMAECTPVLKGIMKSVQYSIQRGKARHTVETLRSLITLPIAAPSQKSVINK